jgi:hypothetical protein
MERGLYSPEHPWSIFDNDLPPDQISTDKPKHKDRPISKQDQDQTNLLLREIRDLLKDKKGSLEVKQFGLIS